MSKYKVHGKIGNTLKSVEMDRGDYSIDRLKSKFSQILGYGIAVQYVSSLGQGSVASDKQLEEAIADSIKRGKYNLEVILIKDGSSVKSVGNYVPQPKTTSNPLPSSSSTSKPTSFQNNSSTSNTTSKPTTSFNNTSNNNNHTTNKPSSSFNTQSSSSNSNNEELDEQLKREINIARTNPHLYINILEERSKSFEGNVLFVNKGEIRYKTKTNEGKDAVMEAINVLKSMSRLQPFEFPKSLSECAYEVANTIGTKPVDKNQFSNIIESHGTYGGELKLLRGHFYEQDDAQDLVIHFLISDGDKNRTSRNILLSESLKIGGIGLVGGNFPRLCTLQFTQEWK